MKQNRWYAATMVLAACLCLCWLAMPVSAEDQVRAFKAASDNMQVPKAPVVAPELSYTGTGGEGGGSRAFCVTAHPLGCQYPDQLGHGSGGIIGATSDLNPGFRVADSFQATQAGDVTALCWWGFYANFTAQSDCSPGPGDTFTVTYYANDAGGHVPGTQLATHPLTGVGAFATGLTVGIYNEYRYEATHPAFTVTTGTCYWIEITNDTLSGPCVWVWETAPPGDNRAAQAGGAGYAVVDYDMAFCIDQPMVSCPVVTGACCLGETCTATNEVFDCLTLGGNWYVHEDCATFQCPLALLCPTGSLFAQLPAVTGGTVANSDELGGYTVYERFEGLGGPICDVHWWGANMWNDGTDWVFCDKDPERFTIELLADDNGAPGAVLASKVVTPVRTDTGETLTFGGDPPIEGPLYRYDADLIGLGVGCFDYASTAWISIRGVDDGVPNCWSMWLSSPDGDGMAYQASPTDYDMSLCLTGPTWEWDEFDSNLEVDIEIDDWYAPGANPNPCPLPTPETTLCTTLLLDNKQLIDAAVIREPGPYATGLDILTEMVWAEMAGTDPDLGPVLVRDRHDRVSSGAITNVVASGGAFVSGDSFFDVDSEIVLANVPSWPRLYTEVPHHMVANGITQLPPVGAIYQSVIQAPLKGDLDGNGIVNGADIPLFIDCFMNSDWGQIDPNCQLADMDKDSQMTQADVTDFVLALLAGSTGGGSGSISVWVDDPDPRVVGRITGVRHIVKGDLWPNACCYEDAQFNMVCVETLTETDCANLGGQWDVNYACNQLPVLCGGGACCRPNAVCSQELSNTDCFNAGGETFHEGLPCDPNPCIGACCELTAGAPTGNCAEVTEAVCAQQNDQFLGALTRCDPLPFGPCRSACCYDDQGATACLETLEDDCFALFGVWRFEEHCTDVPDPCLKCAEPPQNCHVADQQGHGGTLASVSDANPDAGPYFCADDFRPSASGDITDVCWWGFYGDQSSGFPACSPEGGFGDFTIVYYEDDVASPGLPGAIIGGPFTVTPFVFPTGNLIGDNEEMECTSPHPPVTVVANSCYWIEISANTVSSDPENFRCVWLWSTAGPEAGIPAPGNRHAIQGEWPFLPADLNAFDHPWCLNLPVVFTDCDVQGACCADGTCMGNMTRVTCEDTVTDGAWIYGEDCTTYDCPYCITPANCQFSNRQGGGHAHATDVDSQVCVYDNFELSVPPIGGGDVLEVCWDAVWRLSAICNGNDPFAPAPPPAWEVAYYADADADGLPDILTPIATFRTDLPVNDPNYLLVDQVPTGEQYNDAWGTRIWKIWGTHSAVNIPSRQCRWISIMALADDCLALIPSSGIGSPALGGDGMYAEGDELHTIVWAGEDLPASNNTGLTFCIDWPLITGTLACTWAQGACCVGVGNCQMLNVNECVAAGGIWFPQQVCGPEFSCDPPVNDLCADAIEVFDTAPTPYCTWLAGTELGYCTTLATSCGPVADVWYSYQATVTGTTCISICTPGNPGDYDGHITIYSGLPSECAELLEIACDDDNCIADPPSVAEESASWINTTAGEWYLIRIGECENVVGEPTWGCSELLITPNATSCMDAPPP